MKKVLSLFLAFYFLITYVGFGVNTHYCGGKAVKKQLQITQAELDCGMRLQSSICGEYPELKTKSCCQDRYEHFQIDDDLEQQQLPFEFDATIVELFIATLLLRSVESELVDCSVEYIPPLITCNVYKVNQVFLI